MKRSLRFYAFLAIVSVALLSVVLAGAIVRLEASNAFSEYVQTLPGRMGMGMGPGRQMMMGAAEQTFLGAVDRGIWIAAIAAMGVAAAVALLGAYYLSRPIKDLTAAAQTLAAGDLDHRVAANGPAEVGRLAGAFNDMATSLSDAERLRRRLVADVAHELRTPVASIRAQVEGIAEGVLAADPARIASLVEDTAQLSRLVGDLQELSAADAGALSYHMAPIDLGAVVAGEVHRATLRARLGVEVSAACNGPVTATGDADRISQVVRNMLDNALRHTESGTVRVTCAVAEGHALVEIADTGEGIPAEALPYVFERFYRADAARARDTGGSGIGLAISRRIVEDHGGTVFARNGDTGGAVVGFTVPLAG